MADTQRTPIVDKNGKATHVHKSTSFPQDPRGANIPLVIFKEEYEEETKRSYPLVKELHAFRHDCEDCKKGISVSSDLWEKNAKPLDVAELLKYECYDFYDIFPERTGIENKTGEEVFSAVLKAYYVNYQTSDFVAALQEDFLENIQSSNIMDSYSFEEPYYDDIRAVDPDNCGCTECITGEYVPRNEWLKNANVGDFIRFVKGEVVNNAGNTNFNSMFSSYFSDRDISNLQDSLKLEFGKSLIHNQDYIQALAERYSE